MTDIILKQGTGVPLNTDLEVAEVAIDNSTGDMYTKLADGSVKQLNPEGGAVSWNDLTDKPADFPPASHNHDGVYQPVGDYIGEAPNDGEEYARKNQGWVKLQDHNYTGADAVKLTGDQTVAGHKTWTSVATFGDTVTMRGILNGDVSANFGGPVTANSFVKAGGTADQYLMADGSVHTDPALIGSNLDGLWELSDSGPTEGQMTARNQNWLSITEITVHNTDANGYTHNFALMAEGDLVVIQTMDGGAEYLVSGKTPDGLTCKFLLDPVSTYGTFPTAGDSVKVDFIPQAGAGSGIKPGNAAGQVTTWSGTEWEPNSSLIINSDGDASFTRNVKSDGFQFGNYCGTRTTTGTNIVPTDGNGSASNRAIDLGADNYQWNLAHLNETITNSVHSGVAGRAGFIFGGSNTILPSDSNGDASDAAADLGRDANRFRDAYFTGTIDAGAVTINGSPISGGGGLPSGDFTHNGIITAVDFIATSDERAKDNITTAPVGLIDSLKGREWEWKESGEKGSGVVAQELEEVLPHLVHEDDEGMKSVAYNGLVAYLIEELKDCRQRIAKLEAKS